MHVSALPEEALAHADAVVIGGRNGLAASGRRRGTGRLKTLYRAGHYLDPKNSAPENCGGLRLSGAPDRSNYSACFPVLSRSFVSGVLPARPVADVINSQNLPGKIRLLLI